MRKTLNQKAWFFVLPVFILVAFNAAIPLMITYFFGKGQDGLNKYYSPIDFTEH